MNFCPESDCPAYDDSSVKGRKCYYEPQCWRGNVDATTSIAKQLIIPVRETRPKEGRFKTIKKNALIGAAIALALVLTWTLLMLGVGA